MATDLPDNFEERLRLREAMQRSHPLATVPITAVATRGNLPNTPLASSTIAFILGVLFALGILTFFCGGFSTHWWWLTYQLGFFAGAWAFFHWAEFAVTAGWNLEKCSVESYLLDNGEMYHIAHAIALFEYLTTLYFWPAVKSYPYASQIGMLLVIVGQALRSVAMIHASTNFSHTIMFRKRDGHQLVTDGVYAWFRHPSYAGFFYWALGTQLVLQNPISFVVYSALLWRFFYYRTRAEEAALVRFFGSEYEKYRQRVGTKIPFVP